MRTVPIIDDLKDFASVIAEEVTKGISGVQCEIELDFDVAIERIAALRPDAIVLDLMENKFSEILPGEKTWKSVWESTFCPIVIYTASDATLHPTVPLSHPFVKRIQKGSGTQNEVVEALKGFAPAVQSLAKLRAEVEAVIHKVLRDTAGEGHMPMNDPEHLLHAGRRRIAATMDDSTITSNRTMESWEQYLIPAMGESPLTADLLRERGAQWDDPTAYRIVLTPSCDLVKVRCIKTVLVAKCQQGSELVSKMSLSVKANKKDESAERLRKGALTPGVFEGFVPLPSFDGRIPNLVVNLKNLEVLKYESIAPTDPTVPGFDRIASIDSPFREQVAWAYLTTAARPGMPDRDLKPWAEELVKAASTP